MRLPSCNWLPPLLLVSVSVASAKPQNNVGGGYEYVPQQNGVGGGGYDYTPAQNGGGGGGYDYTPQNNNQFVEGNGNGGSGGGYEYTPAVPNQNQNGGGGDGSPAGGYNYSPPAQPRSNSLEGEADANGTSSTPETPMESTTPASESESTSPTEESMPESSSTTSAPPDNGSMNGTSEESTTTESPGETAAASSLDNTVAISQDEPSVSLLPPRPVPFFPAAPEASPPSSSTPLLNVAALSDVPITLLSIAGNSGGTSGNTKNANDLHVDFTRYRYHVESGKLHRIGNTTGVCPENMRYFAVPGKGKSGSCDCDYYQCSRPLIYSAEGNQCFWAWSQGPCGNGEWFVFDKDLKKGGKCVKRPCPQSRSSDVRGSLQYLFQSPHDGVCYEAGTQGYCKDKDERLLIYPGEPIPTCRKFTSCFPLTVPQELQCVYGNKYFHDGNC